MIRRIDEPDRTAHASDPTSAVLPTTHFRVTIAGEDVGFCSVGPLTSWTDPGAPVDRRRPTYATVVLRRALDGSRTLSRWRQAIDDGKDDLREVVIQQSEPATGIPLNVWVLDGAWPCRWTGPTLDAMGGGIAMEEVELAFRRFRWTDEPT